MHLALLNSALLYTAQYTELYSVEILIVTFFCSVAVVQTFHTIPQSPMSKYLNKTLN